MDWYWYIIGIVGCIGIFVFISVCLAGAGSVNKLADPSNLLTKLSDEVDFNKIVIPESDKDWIQSLGWESIGYYQFQENMYFNVWRSNETHSYMLVTQAPTCTYYEFVSEFEQDVFLTTSTSKDAGLFPQWEKHYKENLSILGMNDLCKQHLDSSAFVKLLNNVQPVKTTLQFEDYILDSVSGEMKFIQSLFLWQIRMPYWYFIKRSMKWNKTIKEQHSAEV